MTEREINKICRNIQKEVTRTMKGGVETIGDYGFKCAKEAFKKAISICYGEEQQC